MRMKIIKVLKSKKAITGIETAIILIAFVIVAAAFAFIILSMGFFAGERAKGVISGGLKEAASAIELDGSVIAYGGRVTGSQGNFTTSTTGTLNNVTSIVIYIKLSTGQQPMDLRVGRLTILYANTKTSIDNIYDNSTLCTVTQIVGDSDTFLEEGEKFKITVNIVELANEYGTDVFLGEYAKFRIEVKAPIGAPLIIERTIPGVIDKVMILD